MSLCTPLCKERFPSVVNGYPSVKSTELLMFITLCISLMEQGPQLPPSALFPILIIQWVLVVKALRSLGDISLLPVRNCAFLSHKSNTYNGLWKIWKT